MKSRSFVILILALVVLVLIYIIQSLSTGKKSVSESLTDIVPGFNSSKVSLIKIYKQEFPDSGLYFSKKDDIWLISSYYDAPAKENDIQKLLNDISLLKGEIRSTSAELFGDYEITDDAALHMEFIGSDSTSIAYLLVGKGVPQASKSSFLREAGDDTVYTTNENFLSRFAVWNAEPSQKMPDKRWADMNMTDVDKNTINSIEIETKQKKYVFEKNTIPPVDSAAQPTFEWKQVKPSKGKVLEDKDIQAILNRLYKMMANDIAGREILAEYGLSKPKYSTSFTTDDGQTTSINFGAVADTTSNTRYATVDGKLFIYAVARHNFDAIFETPFEKD